MNRHLRYDVAIVGAGHAGAQLAAALRQKGFDGSILLLGDEPCPPYERPPLSKEYLLGKTDAARMALRPEGFWAEQSIDLRSGVAATGLDPARAELTLADGARVGFAWCVLATGGRPRALRCGGAALAGVHGLRTLADANRIRADLAAAERVAVVGGGYIGLEFAAVAAALGKRVTLVEAAERLLPRVTSSPVSRFFEALHRGQGVEVRFGATVAAFSGADRLEALTLDDGGRIEADMALCGVGLDVHSPLAEAAGLSCADGILVDAFFRSSAPNILAIGDVARHPSRYGGPRCRIESVQHAQESADHAADLILGAPRTYAPVPTFWSQQYDVRLQAAGIARPDDELLLRGDADGPAFSVLYLRDGALAAIDAVNRPRDFMGARALIKTGARLDRDQLADPGVALRGLAAS